MASRKKRGYSDLEIHPTLRDPKRSKSDNRTGLQALTLHQPNDADTLAGTLESSSPTLIASSSSSTSSQTSTDSGSEGSIPSLLESSGDENGSLGDSDDISSSDSEDPSSSSLELNRPAIGIPVPTYNAYADTRDMDSSSSSSTSSGPSSSGSSSASVSASADDNDPSSSSDSASQSGSGNNSSSSSSPSSSSSLPRSPIPLTSQNLSTLQSRLSSLLPTMRAANEQLEHERTQGRLAERDIEHLGEGAEDYIEMDLGLGVLEEKKIREGVGVQAIEDDDDDDDDDAEEESQGEKDVLGRLLGQRREKPGIEVL